MNFLQSSQKEKDKKPSVMASTIATTLTSMLTFTEVMEEAKPSSSKAGYHISDQLMENCKDFSKTKLLNDTKRCMWYSTDYVWNAFHCIFVYFKWSEQGRQSALLLVQRGVSGCSVGDNRLPCAEHHMFSQGARKQYQSSLHYSKMFYSLHDVSYAGFELPLRL